MTKVKSSQRHYGGFSPAAMDGGCKGCEVLLRRRAGATIGRLAETLPALQHDPSRPEDVLKVDADEEGIGGDDPADALRYLVATKPRVVLQRKLSGL